MGVKYFFMAVMIKAKRLCTVDRKLAKSYISIFLVLVLILTSSFAWFTKRNSARMTTNLLEFQSASSLRINKDKFSANRITIPAFTLDEVSSVDGRNIYLPLGASFNTNTSEMFFREGNAGDGYREKHAEENPQQHRSYVYRDFQLKGTSGNTPVYIKSYRIQVASAGGVIDTSTGSVDGVYEDELKVVDKNGTTSGVPDHQIRPPHQCPIRLAFIADSGVRPVVIDPSAQVVDYADKSNAVTLVDENGVPELQETSPNSFSTYYYEHTPLFIIPGGQTLNVTLVVWLEGTMGNSDAYIGKEISVDIDIESNFAEMDTITFVDGSYGDDYSETDTSTEALNARFWVSNPDSYGDPIIACSYEDPYSDETPKRWKTVIMRKTKDVVLENDVKKSGAEWQAEIPKKVDTKIAFYRLTRQNGETQATIYNAWHTRSDINNMDTSKISTDWYATDSFDLQTTRRFFDSTTNTYDNALIYTAIHGNGYSTTTNDNERLAPCVGYWNYTPGSGSNSTGGGGQSGGGGGVNPSNRNCSTTVIIRVPDDLSGKGWVFDENTIGFETDSGGSYFFDSNSNGMQKLFNLPVGDKIVRICKRNTSNVVYYPFSGGTQTWTVPDSSSWTITYTMDNSDHWSHN